ncbi:sugar transferase [Salinimonas sediminis]|uniref:Sugar transferase n=1 Tax=Salinimonas sediminis TaxID=2303538 RepID=A0A346NJL8_9ALTE|nr:sugar transferase [Salinimonas sediminis]AXR05725.1 sugar transferase [Salinimonas sediminis]
MKPLAPVVLFAFNRYDHLQVTLQTLAQCELAEQSSILVYLDGPKTSADAAIQRQIVEYINSVNSFLSVEIVHRESNIGLADNIVSGLDEVMRRYGKAIVLEDDILVSSCFLRYMNDALEYYQDEPRVWHISGWNFPIESEGVPPFFLWHTVLGWGWATWSDRWKYFTREPQKCLEKWRNQDIQRFNIYGTYDFWEQVQRNATGEIKTWAVFWACTVFENNGLCLNPAKSMTTNIGFDGSGTHCKGNEFGVSPAYSGYSTVQCLPQNLTVDCQALDAVIEYTKAKNEARQDQLKHLSTALKRLMQRYAEKRLAISRLSGRRVAIFGTADISTIIATILKNQGVNIIAFLVSDAQDISAIKGLPVVPMTDWAAYFPEIIINCIEGKHYLSVSQTINKILPDVDVVYWQEL